MILNEATVAAYRTLLTSPSNHGLNIRPIKDSFTNCDTPIPKHILYQQYVDQIQKPLPKIIFYILMDEMYPQSIGKAENGDLGYALELLPIQKS